MSKQKSRRIPHPIWFGIPAVLMVALWVFQIVAVLHDVVQDTQVTLDDIRAEGFSQEVIDALSLVTHQKGQPYSEYVIACIENDIARQMNETSLSLLNCLRQSSDSEAWNRLVGLYAPLLNRWLDTTSRIRMRMIWSFGKFRQSFVHSRVVGPGQWVEFSYAVSTGTAWLFAAGVCLAEAA